MKAIALITQANNSPNAHWQFDKIMAAIAYDLDISIVFMALGLEQLKNNIAWKCLTVYGVDHVFFIKNDQHNNENHVIDVKAMTHLQLQKLIHQADIII